MATLEMGDKILVEEPGYRQVHKIIDLLRLELDGVSVREKVGLDIEKCCPVMLRLCMSHRVTNTQWARL